MLQINLQHRSNRLSNLDRPKCPSSMRTTTETKMNTNIVSEIYSYHTNWKEGKVNQMWIEQSGDENKGYSYVAVAHNPRNGKTMEMSNPRTSYQETLKWVRGWCGTFCTLPA